MKNEKRVSSSVPAGRIWSTPQCVRRVLQPPALSREHRQSYPGRRLLRTWSNHPAGKRKDQTQNHPKPSVASQQASRITSIQDAPDSLLDQAASCLKISDDGHPPDAACRPPGTPSTRRNRGPRLCLHDGTTPQYWTRPAGRPARCGSSPQTNSASELPAGWSSRPAQTTIQGVRISVSSPLLGGYDEPELLSSSSRLICLTGADVGHFWATLRPSRRRAA